MSVSVLGNSIGKDALGEYLLSELRDKNISHEEIILNDSPTPTCSIFVDRDGERTIVSSGYSYPAWTTKTPLFLISVIEFLMLGMEYLSTRRD